jgi:hypothetical protein
MRHLTALPAVFLALTALAAIAAFTTSATLFP